MSECRDDVLTELSSLCQAAIESRFQPLRTIAVDISDDVVNRVRLLWGGQLIYFRNSSTRPNDGRRNKGDQALVDIASIINECLRSHGIPGPAAGELGQEVSAKLHISMSSELVYVPKKHDGQMVERDRKIIQEFDGTNHLELCRKYHIGIRRLYQLLADR